MLQSSAYRQKRRPRRVSSLSSSSSTRLLRRGESGPPYGVPSSTGLTKPSSVTPDLRNARMSLSTRLSVTVRRDDLGGSGGSIKRPGFERLLSAICEGRVGAVFAIEASRLARNGRDWHTLIEFCGLVGTVIVDEDGIYDPRHPNDRLLLGMKAAMSELELSLFRQRSQEALKQKARPDALFLSVAAGYVRAG